MTRAPEHNVISLLLHSFQLLPSVIEYSYWGPDIHWLLDCLGGVDSTRVYQLMVLFAGFHFFLLQELDVSLADLCVVIHTLRLNELKICPLVAFDKALVVVKGLFLLITIFLNLMRVTAHKWECKRICHLKLSFEHSIVVTREEVFAIYQTTV